MADAAQSTSPASSGGSQPSPRAVGRRRRLAGRWILALALCGVGIAAWSRDRMPDDWLAPYFAPRYDALPTQDKPQKKPHEVYEFPNATIPKDRIVFAGLKIDDMPSLTDPEFLPAEYGTHVFPDDRVIGVAVSDDAKAYPLKILAFHEAVNDHVGGKAVLVTYCTLCDSAAVFHRSFDGREMEFGISGMLFNSNTLLYSRTGEGIKSLWSQMKCEAVTGPNSGTKLATIPLEVTTWADWTRRYPETRVLSKFTDHEDKIDYRKNPTGNYLQIEDLWYPAEPADNRLPRKTPVLAVWTNQAARAYPLPAFAEWQEPREFRQSLDGEEFTLRYDPATKSLRVIGGAGGLQQMYALWFAWYAFNPKTELFKHTDVAEVLY